MAQAPSLKKKNDVSLQFVKLLSGCGLEKWVRSGCGLGCP